MFWSRPDDIARAAITAELGREVGEEHPLAAVRRQAVDVHARCSRCELTCFALANGEYSIVRLDWSGRSDGRTWPRTRVARDHESLLRLLAEHSREHDAGHGREHTGSPVGSSQPRR